MDVYQLNECFRCGDEIVETANRLIAHDKTNISDPMIGSTGRKGSVEVVSGNTEEIANVISGLRSSGFGFGDIAILARNHRSLKRTESMLRDHQIPTYRVGASFDVCGTTPFKLLMATMRLSVNQRDDRAFLRLVETLGLDGQQYGAVRSRAASHNVSHFVAMQQLGVCSHPLVPVMTQSDVAEQDRVQQDIGVDLLSMIETFGTTNYLLMPAWRFWCHHCKTMTIEDALRWFATYDTQDDLPTEDCVTLLTCHAAKGLEWPCVIVINLNEGEFPSGRAIRDDQDVAEERRVAYVAMTRAEERLVLHYREREHQNEDRPIKDRSRFLDECRKMEMEFQQ